MRAAERAERELGPEAAPDSPRPRRIERRSSTRPPSNGHRSSRRTWLYVGIGVLVVGAWLAFAAVQLARARQEALAGIDGVESLRRSLSVESVDSGEDEAALREANGHFRRANEHASSPAVMPLRALPVLGRQIRSVDAMTDAASKVTDIAETQVSQARELLDSAQVDPEGRVPFVRHFKELSTIAGAQLDEIHLGPADGLIAPLESARNRFASELASLRTSADHVSTTSSALVQLLEGPHRYLLLAANNAEMRVGSGAFLSLGVLTTNQGSLDLGPMEQSARFLIPDDRVQMPREFAERWGWLEPNREWRNLASSPSFDENAQLAVQMWKATTGEDVDGVVGIDVVALRALLAATGPVDVDGVNITANNVINDIMLKQYVRDAQSGNTDDRREHLSRVANAVVDRLENESWDPYTLASRLVEVASGRHLLLWSHDAKEQSGWDAAGISGRLQPSSLMVGLHNRGANKLDQFVNMTAGLETRVLSRGSEVTVKVSLRNTTPTDLPAKVAGPFPGAVGAADGRYQGLLVLQIPGSAADVTMDDDSQLVANGPDGRTRVVATYVELDRGATTDRTIKFVLPKDDRELRVEPSARVPGIAWTAHGDRWVDESARIVTW